LLERRRRAKRAWSSLISLAHLSASDREAIVAILKDTKPGVL